MKKFGIIFMVSCLVGPYLGIFTYLKHEQRIIKKEIKHKIIEGIDKNELVQLSFTETELKNEVRWEHAKEFEYNGEMYDVVETANDGNQIVYWCWWDHKETSLNKKLNHLLAKVLGQTNDDKNPTSPIASFLKLVYVVPPSIIVSNVTILEKEKSTIPSFFIFGFLKKPNLPPPQILNIA